MTYRKTEDPWKKILTELEKGNPLFSITNSLRLGFIEVIDGKKITIFLDRRNIVLLRQKYIKSLIPIVHRVTKSKLDIEFRVNNFESELIEKRKNFLVNHSQINYYIGDYNGECLRNLQEFMENDSINTYYLWGDSGMGKTHMMGVLLNLYMTKVNGMYIDSFEFINRYYEYKRASRDFSNFTNWLLTYDLIVFDSFQITKNKNEIIAIISDLLMVAIRRRKKIIFVVTNKEHAFEGINLNLISKFSIVKGMSNPEIGDIRGIIDWFIHSQNRNIRFSEKAIFFLLETIGNNVQVIINKLVNILMLIGNPDYLKIIDLDQLKKILLKIDFFKKNEELLSYSNNQQVKTICRKLNFNVEEIFKRTRKKDVILRRNIVIYLLKKKLNLTHESIGRIFNKDHSTISNSLKKINNKLKDENFKKYLSVFL